MIEDCLKAKGVRYFHGHHDTEYFFLLDYLDNSGCGRTDAEARHGKLHVHLIPGVKPGEITVTVTPDRYYPAEFREHLIDVVERWAAPGSRNATVYPSSDAHLVGVVVRITARPAGLAEATVVVDGAVAAALDLFARLQGTATAPGSSLRDVG